MSTTSWTFVAIYYLAQILLVLGGFWFAKSAKRLPAYICTIGFSAFLIGNLIMIDATRDESELRQTQNATQVEPSTKAIVGKSLSSLGFLVGSGGFFWLGFVSRRQ